MNENADKHLDELSRKVMGKTSLESPSFDFTQSVMSQIKTTAVSQLTAYKPLISKPMWFFIAILSLSGVCYILLGPQSQSLWLQKLKLDNYISFSDLTPNLEMSQVTLYVFVLFAIMFSIQIPILKRQLNKRFD